MVSVIEYGENIGTLKNLFVDHSEADLFVKKLINWSKSKYECIGLQQWYCNEKKEYIKIEMAA